MSRFQNENAMLVLIPRKMNRVRLAKLCQAQPPIISTQMKFKISNKIPRK